MIKSWKLFLESKDPFEGDLFREEILNNVNDILSVLKDDGLEIRYSYGIDDVNVFPGTKPHNEFRIMVFSNEKDFIESNDFQSITHLHNYLCNEGFEPVSKNILKELDIQFHIKRVDRIGKNKILSHPISRFIYSIEKGLKADWIKFSYKLPFEKWKGDLRDRYGIK
jgi:hypothetical protein